MKNILLNAVIVMMVTDVMGIASAATPSGFISTTIVVNAQITAVCQETTHASFPDPITIDTLAGSDQTFLPTSEETLKCSNGTVFTGKVSSANGTAVDQACTSSGVSSMALMSAGTPADTIAYTFMCAGDTDGTGRFIWVGSTTAKAAAAHADYSDTVALALSYENLENQRLLVDAPFWCELRLQ
jgi:hypothetical protein